MKFRHHIIKNALAAILCGFSIYSCELNWKAERVSFQPQIVVEGWIDEGLFANVILTQSMRFNYGSNSDNIEMMDIPIRWAKVTVSDGEREEILVSRMDTDYFPPFIYTGSRIRGEAGKTYTLKVEYSGRTLIAETTIPGPVTIEDIEVSQSEQSDTLYTVSVSFRDNPEEKNWYKVFSMVKPDDSRYLSSYMGVVSDEAFPSDHIGSISVNRPIKQLDIEKYSAFFKRGDTVYVKLTQLSEDGFNFWSDYENALTSGDNIIFPSTNNLRGNVSGGFGIWCGYGTDIKSVIIPKE